MAPDGVSLHTSRVFFADLATFADPPGPDDAAELLARLPLQAIIYAWTCFRTLTRRGDNFEAADRFAAGRCKNPTARLQQTLAQAAAKTLGLEMQVLTAGTNVEIEMAFANLIQRRAEAILVGDSPFFLAARDKLIALCAHHAIPAIFQWREYVVAGGLISYGTSLAAAYRQMGVYIGRILHGEKPADLPVMQSSVFELVVNLNTAKALGIVIPPSLLAQADEVIE
jgi:hypothetical protein